MFIKRIKNTSIQGVELLKDLRRLAKTAGYGNPTFEWNWRFYDYELFIGFYREFALPMILSFVGYDF